MRLPLPARVLVPVPAPWSAGRRLRSVLLRLWAGLRPDQIPEACLRRARAHAALQASYEARLEVYPATPGRRARQAALRGGEWS